MRPQVRRTVLPTIALCLIGAVSAGLSPLEAQSESGDVMFDWDLVSLEQNNIRFNASVLSGFHSIRSPGVTPRDAWKAGLGLLYSREELSVPGTDETFDNDRLILNPKLNYGLHDRFEFGAGLELNAINGKEVTALPGGGVNTENETDIGFSAVAAGVKWNFLTEGRFRLSASFDTRVALQTGEFGMLSASLFNFELDADYAFTSRFSMITNLQFLTSDRNDVEDQGILDVAAAYGFSDQFRSMLFLTVQEDDEASDAIFFFGLAGQYVHEIHSFTLAMDFQLNDARRDIRIDNQIDLEFSYTISF